MQKSSLQPYFFTNMDPNRDNGVAGGDGRGWEKRSRRDSDHWALPAAETKNAWSNDSILTPALMALSFIKHRHDY